MVSLSCCNGFGKILTPDNKIFVCGTEVDDFHTISKEYIFTLNVCVTQELHRRMEAQNVIIKELQDKLDKLYLLIVNGRTEEINLQ